MYDIVKTGYLEQHSVKSQSQVIVPSMRRILINARRTIDKTFWNVVLSTILTYVRHYSSLDQRQTRFMLSYLTMVLSSVDLASLWKVMMTLVAGNLSTGG
jgi:hypothetical protein